MAADDIFRREEWAAAYQNTEEFPDGFWLECEGELPEALNGTYLRNGPGLFSHGKDSFAHPFDGHGLVASIVFTKGKAFFRSRYVRTKEYTDETQQGRILYKGTFGTLVPGGIRKNLFQVAPRNVANTGILSTGGKCLALFEAGQPHSLDPVTLETKGIDLLGGSIPAGAPFSTSWGALDRLLGYVLVFLGLASNLPGIKRVGGEAVCAHPVTDPSSGNPILFSFCLRLSWVACSLILWNWTLRLWLPGLVTSLHVREFDQDLHQQSVVDLDLPGYCFLHDLGLTASHYVIFQNPVRLKMFPLLLGTLCPAHCIQWTGEPPKVHLIKRPSLAESGRKAAFPAMEKPAVIAPVGFQLTATSGQAVDVAGNLQDSSCNEAHKSDALLSVLEQRRQSHHGGQHMSMQEESSCSQSFRHEAVKTTVDGQDSGFIFHQANAYESKDGRCVTVDCIRYPRMPDFQEAGSSGKTFVEVVDPDVQPISQLWRYEVDAETGSTNAHMLASRAMEFPAINPDYIGLQHRFVYTAAALHPTQNRPQQALAKLDTSTMETMMWSQGNHYYVGEPVFVPCTTGQAEDNGWIISVCYNARLHTSECVVLCAADMTLLARLALKHALPHGLHGAWDPECHLSGSCRVSS